MHHNDKKGRKDTSWNNVAGWYDKHVSSASDHQREIIIPGALRMLGVKRGEKVLDVGCGQGEFCRELHKAGAAVTGIDAAKKLIDIARRKPSGNITYLVGDAAKLTAIDDKSFDAVTSILAVQNMDPLEDVAMASARVLKAGGRLIWILNHPCFRIPRQSGWGFDEKRKLQYRRVDRYMSPLKIPIQMHPGASPNIHTWTFHRPLSEYFNSLNSLGMAVTALEEWVSRRKSLPGKSARSENMSREEIPLFLAIKAVKL